MAEYLAYMTGKREKEAVKNLFTPFISPILLAFLVLKHPMVVILELRKSRLTEHIDSKTDNSGDIDILIAECSDGSWPPNITEFTAIEVKCARWSIEDDKLKSTFSSPKKQVKARLQTEDLVGMGCFQRAGILDIIANPPFTGDFLGSSSAANDALLLAEKTYLQGRLDENSQAGQLALSIGAVEGGTELIRGSNSPRLLRKFSPIPQLETLSPEQEQIKTNLKAIIARLPLFNGPAAIYIDCESCKEVVPLDSLFDEENERGERLIRGYGCRACEA